MFRKFSFCLAISSFAASALPAMAQETAGTISGTLDGAPVIWTFSAAQSDFLWGTSLASISLMGWPDAAPEGFAMISIGFGLQQGSPANPEVLLMPRGDGLALFGRDIEITLTEAGIEGEALRLSGSMSGVLGQTSDYGANVDMSAPRQIDLTFDGVIAAP